MHAKFHKLQVEYQASDILNQHTLNLAKTKNISS